ncbi:MAG: rRNA maturation RNase YbeY [Acidobacteria bacterium]|nr:rRNA maturation RNase YbeY [Acidobacteriota bacterium]
MEKVRDRPARLRVAVTDGLGVRVRTAGLSRWLAQVAPPQVRGTVTLALITDGQIRSLNRRYRRLDRSTDVLSFPALSFTGPRRTSQRDSHLGDVAISLDTARRQARELGHSVRTELRVLALHGLLHLLGYDHERDPGEMARVERRLRRRGGLAHSLTERT